MIFGRWTEGTPYREGWDICFWKDDEIGSVPGGLIDESGGFCCCFLGGEKDWGNVACGYSDHC